MLSTLCKPSLYFTNSTFPTASDLYNPDGNKYDNSAAALSAFNNSKIIEVDAGGEVITGYIFADNYFELYINGVAVGKDAIPFTDFNSHIVKFRVSKPYTIAMKLVDWEERLGLGCEKQGTKKYHPGDGGLVAVFKDTTGAIVCTTNSDWKAQTFYIAPIKDFSCVSEVGTTRYSTNCNTDDVSNGSGYAALHWAIPAGWMNENLTIQLGQMLQLTQTVQLALTTKVHLQTLRMFLIMEQMTHNLFGQRI
jgi:hypothetical protein